MSGFASSKTFNGKIMKAEHVNEQSRGGRQPVSGEQRESWPHGTRVPQQLREHQTWNYLSSGAWQQLLSRSP